MIRKYAVVPAFLLLTAATSIESTRVVPLNSVVLPSPRSRIPGGYDGVDSIYLFGGKTGEGDFSREIIKFNVDNNSLEILPALMPPTVFGTCAYAGEGDFYYVGGHINSSFPGSGGVPAYTEIWNFRTTNPGAGMHQVSNSPVLNSFAGSTADGEGNMYIVGGYVWRGTNYYSWNKIYKFNKYTNGVAEVATLPAGRLASSVVWDPRNSTAYVFGGEIRPWPFLDDVLAFDSDSGRVQRVANLPSSTHTCAVWVGDESAAYILGGLPDAVPVNYTPDTNRVEVLDISGWPLGIYGVGCAYVERLRRIYVFGGFRPGDGYRDEIMHIDLDNV